MYRNTVSMCRGDGFNLQSDMSIFRTTNSVFSGNYIREAVLFESGSENNRRKVKGTFCAYSIMRPMVHHIEKYSGEKLFDRSDMTFLYATGK